MKRSIGILSLGLLFSITPLYARAKKKGKKRDNINLTVVTKNMLWGNQANADLTPEVGGYDPVLPSPITTLIEAYDSSTPTTEQDLARMFENIWQQANSEELLGTKSRLDAMAKELAAIDADVICLQECALITNNPVRNPDGTPRIRPFQIGNGVYGTEDSPEFARTFNFATMLQKRLKDTHCQDFDIVSQIIMDGSQGPRTLDNLDESEAIVSQFNTVATLVRKSLKAEVVHSYEKTYTFNRFLFPAEVIVGSDPAGEETVLRDFLFFNRRGYTVSDLRIKGQMVRIINTHMASTNNFTEDPTAQKVTKYRQPPAARAAQALELLYQEVLPSPHPVILVGDLNVTSLTGDPGTQDIFEIGAYQTLVGSVLPDGTPTNTGGAMVDACQALHPGECDTPRYNTIGLRNLSEPPFNLFRGLREPSGTWRFRIDYLLFRDGDGIKVCASDVTQVEAFQPTPTQQWAWTSDHRGVFATLKIPRKGMKK